MKWPYSKPAERTAPLQAADSPGGGAAAAPTATATALETLVASRIIGDGEVVLMILKPSLWYIPLGSASFLAIVWVASLALAVIDHRLHDRFYFELGVLASISRLVWAALQWMGRLYILTDMRVLTLSGVGTVDVFNCPLRKIARTRQITPAREKLIGVGSIEIIPADEEMPVSVWATVAKPVDVHQRLMAAISRARQNGGAGS